jgi:competence protein ComEA
VGLLPLVGPTLAERVVARRRAVGGFETLESVGEVSGVGPRTLERWRGHVVVERQ